MKAKSLEVLRRKLGRGLEWPVRPEKQGIALAHGIGVLRPEPGPLRKPEVRALAGHPFDSELLQLSKLYRRSRELYLEQGGRFRAALVTSPRTLSSPILVEQMIEYSPTEQEMVWAATDPVQKKDLEHLLEIRTFSGSMFHEQSHRILWKFLPPPPRYAPNAAARGVLRRYQNFAEALVIATDMALGDELGPRVAPFFYLAGVGYDPGTTLGSEGLSRRMYRNYLQAAVLATYLNIELYSDEYIDRAVRSQFPMLGKELLERVIRRSGRLDRQFITMTATEWQKRYSKLLSEKLARPKEEPLLLSDDPLANPLMYLIGERWFEKMGL